jgi:uncharacterized protein (DUF58 family)
MTAPGARTVARRRVASWRLAGSGWAEEHLARPRAWARPITEVTSAAAWVLLGLSLTSLMVWSFLGWGELVAAAGSCAALVLVSTVFLIGTHRLSARLDLSRDRVVVGERANGRLLVANESNRRSLPATVELPVGLSRADFALPSIVAGDSHEQLFAVPTSRRAVLVVGPVTSVRADPLRLLRREQALAPAQELFVHPRTVPVEGSAAGMVRDLEGRTTRQLTESDISFHALRDYQRGDDRRYIHWKTSVRVGKLMVRQFEQTRRSHLLVLVSTRLDDYRDDEEFETAISVAGSLGVQALREQHGLDVSTSTGRLGQSGVRGLLDALSGVEFERAAPLASVAARRAAGSVTALPSVAVLVSGSASDSAELRRACRRFPLDARTLIVRCRADDSDLTIRSVSGFDLATISRLEDLGPAIRKVAG